MIKFSKIKAIHSFLRRYSFNSPFSFSQFTRVFYLVNSMKKNRLNVFVVGTSKHFTNSIAARQGLENFHLFSRWVPGLLSNKFQVKSQNVNPDVLIVMGFQKNLVAILEAKQNNIPVICFANEASIEKHSGLFSYVLFCDVSNSKSLWFVMHLLSFNHGSV